MASLRCLGGVDEIGGNRLLVEDGKRKILLDFGLSFAQQGRFFHEYLSPRKVNGLGDWLRMGLAPDLRGVYRQDWLARIGRPDENRALDAVLVSHAHMDHIGLIPLLRPDIPILLSPKSRAILDVIQTTGAQGPNDFVTFGEDFTYRPNKKGGHSKGTKATVPQEDRPLSVDARWQREGVDVVAHDVDHSLPGARGYVVTTSAGSLAYTGDFRFHGRHGNASQRFAKAMAGVDVLVTEGTNLGVEDPDAQRTHDIPEALSEKEVAQRIQDAISSEEGFVGVAYPPRDVDRLLSFHEAAKKTGRRLLLSFKQAHLLAAVVAQDETLPSLDDANIGIYVPRKGMGAWTDREMRSTAPDLGPKDYSIWERDYLEHPHAATAADVRADPRAYLVPVDIFNMTELVDIEPKGGAFIQSKTEPFNDEMDIDYRRLENWLLHFGLRQIKAHASGHATAEELEHMIDAAKPRRIVPVHTLNARRLQDRFGDRVVRPSTSAEITL